MREYNNLREGTIRTRIHKSRAEHKYNKNTREGARRIAQSQGYRYSLLDSPQMIALLNRAGIELFNELPEGFSEGDTIKFT